MDVSLLLSCVTVYSDVTRVGVTQGGATDRCHPIFSSKNLTTFLVIVCQSEHVNVNVNVDL